MKIANLILREIEERLGFLNNVGLDYLTLSRAAGTLSGRSAADQACNANRLKADRCPLHP